jgi:ankyrin repeat protein
LQAAYYGDLEGLKRAVSEHPECVNFSDDFTGATALHFSAGLGNYSCVRYLLSVPGIDLSLTDNEGKTAIQYAIRSGHNEIFVLIADRVFPNRHVAAKLGL